MCQAVAKGNSWAGYREKQSCKFRQIHKLAIADRAHNVELSSGLITIVVMTLLPLDDDLIKSPRKRGL